MEILIMHVFAIKGKEKISISQLRTSSHHLHCEMDRWKVPKEGWKERICMFCNRGVMETKWHFIKEYTTYEDICNQYKDKLHVNNIKELFDKTRIHKATTFLI